MRHTASLAYMHKNRTRCQVEITTGVKISIIYEMFVFTFSIIQMQKHGKLIDKIQQKLWFYRALDFFVNYKAT